MSAARKKSVPLAEIESVDLISLLTMPGRDGIYEGEISVPEESDFVPEVVNSAPINELDSLHDLMGAASANSSFKSSQESAEKASADVAKPVSPLHQSIEIVENDSLAKISQEISVCQKCELWKTRTKTVPGIGLENAKLVFIGEAPGADEDTSGIPFVGKAGQHLDKIMTAAGLAREKVFICNILKCRPPENRNPTLPEMICCTPFLQRQLRIIKPKLIACLGNVAIKYVIGSGTPGITKIHGQWFDSIFSIPTMAMYHPSYLIRSESREKGSPNWQMWQDIQKLKKRYDSI